MPKLLFRNLGGGRFSDVTASAGPAVQLPEVSRGAAFGDVDNDGDTDVLVTNNDGPVRLLLNQAGARGNWLQVRLQQNGGNRMALGSRVGVSIPGRPTIWRRVRTDGSYLVANDPRVHLGLGAAKGPVTVTVEWLGGAPERFEVPEVNRLVTLRRKR